MISGKTVLITGGTGSFGRAMVEHLLLEHDPKKVIVYSRNEENQVAMRRGIPSNKLRFFIGDVRDPARLERAFREVNYVIHAAALKHVDWCAYNPDECKKTNVDGAINIVEAAIKMGVEKVLAVSSDKAVNPCNTYGASKLLSDHLFIDGNRLSGSHARFSVIRFGNFTGSSQSVIPHFKRLHDEGTGTLPVTDCRMTRYFISLGNAVKCALQAMEGMEGGEIFVPRMPKVSIKDLALYIHPSGIKEVGRRPGEKLHEQLVTEPDLENLRLWRNFYVVGGRLGNPCRLQTVLSSSGADECDLEELTR